MGKFDSTETRVVPLFEELEARDETGRMWLPRLLTLPKGGNEAELAPGEFGPLMRASWGESEMQLAPPRSLLLWLARNTAWERRGDKKVVGFYLVEGERDHDESAVELPARWREAVREVAGGTKVNPSRIPWRRHLKTHSAASTWQEVCREFKVRWDTMVRSLEP